MYYRVKRFNEKYMSMHVLDEDSSLSNLKRRTTIDCSGIGSKVLNNVEFIDSQPITCQNTDSERPSDIVSAD